VACKVEYDRQAGQGRRRRVVERTVDEAGKIRTFFISIACNHCVNPACMAACPDSTKHSTSGGPANRKAIWKDTTGEYSGGLAGVVRLDKDDCIACRRCEWACPWSQPQYDPFGGGDGIPKVHKCEWCWERVAAWKTDHVAAERLAGNTTDAFTGGANDSAGNLSCDIFNPVTAEGKADKRRQSACTATCIGRTLYNTMVDPMVATESYGPGGTYDYFDFKDYQARDGSGPAARTFYRSGAGDGTSGQDAGDAYGNRGSKYLADHRLTHPALRVCNKVYKKRDGGVE